MREQYRRQRYLVTAIDPVHIGTGGYRMDRVDNTIIRDMDGLPKIPGSSLSGAIRSYAALQESSQCGSQKKCTEICNICRVFGYTSDKDSRKGLTSFYDARIVFFPVATMVGPVWITTIGTFRDLLEDEEGANEERFLVELDAQIEKTGFLPLAAMDTLPPRINLGWLMFNKKFIPEVTQKLDLGLKGYPVLEKILPRAIVVHPFIFGQIVNDHLEVRTSVSIDPITGAGVDGALFTYEAIPRSTVLWFDLVIANPQNYELNDWTIDRVEGVLEPGISLLEHLGVGGMTTRGFGRIRVERFSRKGEADEQTNPAK